MRSTYSYPRPRLALIIFWGAFGCGGCKPLDGFLYAPQRVDAGTDLLASVSAIPPALRQEVNIPSRDATLVNTYLLRHRADDTTAVGRHQTWILYCHGNARHVGSFARRAEALWLLGYNVALFDYRGYGKTPGKPTEQGLYEDARAVRDYLKAQVQVDSTHLALYGYSLGTAVCGQLADETPTPALLLEAPFTSLTALVEDNEALAVPRSWYVSAEMDTLSKIVRHKGALLVMHGQQDRYIQVSYGQRIWRAAEGAAWPNLLWVRPEADHDSVPCQIGRSPAPTQSCEHGFDADYLRRVQKLHDMESE